MKRTGDIEIGKRMFEEICRVFPDKSFEEIYVIFGTTRNALWYWRNGGTPGGYFLAKIMEFGGDVEYILSGKKKL